ncbi:MAG: trypsin-like serine protease with C-terminal PDZ [Planctomycetota bacterium]|nr:MAG: trypsin-like serine protease with C-terminal PDZ [Planctomycetota bacterium]
MPRPLLAVVFLAAASVARSQNALPEAKLKELKEATVLVKTVAEKFQSTGTGFLFMKDGDAGFIATNAHVVAVPEGAKRQVSVVFYSGTKDEWVAEAVPIGEDPERDLAILRVYKSKLPKPLSISVKAKVRETTPVYIFGFPFGELLATSEKHPAITVGRGSVSSLRTGDDGEVAIIQIDGDINPGNSGGPIVDVSGSIVGVTVAKVEGTGIGFAIPPRELDLMLLGRISGVRFKQISNAAGTMKVEVNVTLIDPLGKTQGVAIYFVQKDRAKGGEPAKGGAFAPIGPDPLAYSLPVAQGFARGEVTLSGDPSKDVVFLYQLKRSGATGTSVYYPPGEFLARFSGSEPDVKPPGDKPEPDVAPRNLAGTRKTMVDAVATEIVLDPKTTLPCLFWSQDGAKLYAVEQSGVVHRISWPELEDEKRLATRETCSWAGLTKEGVLVMLPSREQAWLLDPQTLQPKLKFGVGTALRFASSPESSFAYFQRERSVLDAYNLKTGELVKSYSDRKVVVEQGSGIRKHKEGVSLAGFDFPTLTPDGIYFFCVGFECLHRFKVEGPNLTYVEMGPRIGQGAQRLEISADSKYVCLPSSGGNYPVSDHPPGDTYIYKVSDLLVPILTIGSGKAPCTVAFDQVSGRIYTQSAENQLIVFGGKGGREKDLRLPAGDVRQILAHPIGAKVVLLAETKIYAVELGSGPPTVGGTTAPRSLRPEPLPPSPAPGSAMPFPAELRESARLPLRAAVSDLWISDDGATLFALDLSDGRVLRLKGPDLSVEAEAAVPPGCAAMAVSAKGDRVYVASRGASREVAGKGARWRGRLTVLEAGTLKLVSEQDFEGDPLDIAASNSGLVAITCQAGDLRCLMFEPARGNMAVEVKGFPGAGFVRVHPDQARFYVGSVGTSPGDYGCCYLFADAAPQIADEAYHIFDSRGHGEHPLEGDFLLSPDGKLLLGSTGAVMRLGATRDKDLEWRSQADPWIAATAAPGCDTVFLSTVDGEIKTFALSSLTPGKTVKPGGVFPLLALDPSRRILYALRCDLADVPERVGGSLRAPHIAGDLVAWPLEKK